MKHRFIIVIACLLTVCVLSGCAASSERAKDPVTDGFACAAQITYGEMEIEARLSRTAEEAFTVSFESPKSLKGVTVGLSGADMTLELGGMSVAVPAERVPQRALILCLARVLEAAHPTGQRTEDGYVIEGEAAGESYTLVCDPDSGLPRSLTVPSQELTVYFTDVTMNV